MLLKRIDRYIIKKFLVTFSVALVLILSISVVFDISEKIDNFYGRSGPEPTLHEVVFDYYFNFIPYFANLFSPFFVFISVIFFTSRMASNLEIVTILNTGTSYFRILRPFMLSAILVAIFSFSLTNYVIPEANLERLAFEKKYIRRSSGIAINFHRYFNENTYVFVERFDQNSLNAFKFSIEIIKNGKLHQKIMSKRATYDTVNQNWHLINYIQKIYANGNVTVYTGQNLDTVFAGLKPDFFSTNVRQIQTMNNSELDEFIEREMEKGSEFVVFYQVEKQSRRAMPFSTIILTLIAVPIASRKVRGGIGLHLAIGVTLAFSYIFMMRVTTTYAISGIMPVWLAIWLPNIVYGMVGLVLTKYAQK